MFHSNSFIISLRKKFLYNLKAYGNKILFFCLDYQKGSVLIFDQTIKASFWPERVKPSKVCHAFVGKKSITSMKIIKRKFKKWEVEPG